MEKVLRVIRFDLSASWKSITITLCFYFIFGIYYAFAIGNLSVIPVSIMFWVSMITGIPFFFRDKYSLEKLLVSLPVKRTNIIRGKYLFAAIMGAIGIAMSEIMICVSAGVFHIGFEMKDMYIALCIGLIIYSLIVAIHLPIYSRVHHTQAVLISPLFLYFCYVICSQLYYTGVIHFDFNVITSAAWRFSILTLAGTLLLSSILMFLSYLISCKLFINKDL